MEQIQVMLNYPQVHTDMIFVNIQTVPLEQRSEVECNRKSHTITNEIEDGDVIMPHSYTIRKQLKFPEWRQHRDTEVLILQGLLTSILLLIK